MSSDCYHHVDLCPDCGGVRASVMQGIDVSNVQITGPGGAALRPTGKTRVYVGPLDRDCPNTTEAGRG